MNVCVHARVLRACVRLPVCVHSVSSEQGILLHIDLKLSSSTAIQYYSKFNTALHLLPVTCAVDAV